MSTLDDPKEFRRYLLGGMAAAAAYPVFQLYFHLLARGVPWAWNHRILWIGGTVIGYLLAWRRAQREGRHPVWLYSWGGCILYTLGLLATESDAALRWTSAATALACLAGAVAAAARGDGVSAMLIPLAWILWLAPRSVLAPLVHPWSIVMLQNFLSVAVAILVFMHAVTPSNGRRALSAGLAGVAVFGCILLALGDAGGARGTAASIGPDALGAGALLLVPLAVALGRHVAMRPAESPGAATRRFLTDQSLARAKSY